MFRKPSASWTGKFRTSQQQVIMITVSTGRATARHHYSQFFTTERNHLNQKLLVQNTRNIQGQPTLENSAYEIKGLNGKDYLFTTVEDGPRDTVLAWAKM